MGLVCFIYGKTDNMQSSNTALSNVLLSFLAICTKSDLSLMKVLFKVPHWYLPGVTIYLLPSPIFHLELWYTFLRSENPHDLIATI